MSERQDGNFPVYMPESRQLASEFANPIFILDKPTETRYAVYILNQHLFEKEVPVILDMPAPLTRRLGRVMAGTCAQQIDRPIIVNDTVGTGATSLLDRSWQYGNLVTIESVAESELRILDQLDIEEAVFVGHWIGGVIAFEKAKQWSEAARQLVTISTPAFSDGLLVAMKKYWQHEQATIGPLKREAFKRFNLGAVIRSMPKLEDQIPLKVEHLISEKLESLADTARLDSLATALFPTTRILDIVTEDDHFTPATAHKIAIAERNAFYPGTATGYILNGNNGRHFTVMAMPAIARLIDIWLTENPEH